MRFAWLIAAALLAAPAHAQNYGAAPVVRDQRSGADGGAARASIDVHAPPAAVWAVLADCGKAVRFMSHLISCRVLERGQGWEVRDYRVRGGPFRGVLRNVSRISLEPNSRLSFSRIAGDWSRSEGEWRLTPIDGGQGTHVEYEVIAAMEGGLPPGVSRSFVVRAVRNTLAALRREAEGQPAAS